MFRKLSSVEFPQLKALQTEISFFCEKNLFVVPMIEIKAAFTCY